MEIYGAQLGDIFVEVPSIEKAQKVLEELKDKKIYQNVLQIVCIPIPSYVGYYLPLLKEL